MNQMKSPKLSAIEQAYDKSRAEKYQMTKLEIDTAPARPSYSTEPTKPTEPSRHDAQFKQSIKDKYGVTRLSLVGQAEKPTEQTFEDRLIADTKSRSAGMKLATASLTYQNKPIRLWYEISI
jgi:hypothetical protein